MNLGVVAPFVSITPANVKRRECNDSEAVEEEFYNQFQEVKFSKIVGKYTLPQKPFVFNAVPQKSPVFNQVYIRLGASL